MDALKRPLRIPPEFSRYAEEKKLFELYERMVSELLVARPEDPLTYLHEYLSQKKDDGTTIIIVINKKGVVMLRLLLYIGVLFLCSPKGYCVWSSCFRPAYYSESVNNWHVHCWSCTCMFMVSQ